MKIETLRDPIPQYETTIRDKLHSRRVRLAQQVTREKQSKQQQREQEKQRESDEEKEETLDVLNDHSHEKSARSLDVVV